MNLTKIQILSGLIGFGAILDTAFQLLTDNVSLLVEVGLEPKLVSVIKLIGLMVSIFSTSLLAIKNKYFNSQEK